MTNSNQPSSQRILSNTIVLFLRMLLLTIVNLYSIRIILGRMGTEDYGIYNAVAGVVTISSFIASYWSYRSFFTALSQLKDI